MDLLQKWQSANGASALAALDVVCAHASHLITSKVAARLRLIAAGADKPDPHYLNKLAAAYARCPKREPTADVADEAQEADSKEPEQPAALPAVSSAKAKALHKEQAYHHALMSAAATDEERAEHAGRVLELSKALDAEYDRLRSGSEDKPADTVPDESDNFSKLKRLHSLRARISKLRNKLIPSAVGKRKADLEAELAQKQAEKEQLENDMT